MIGPDEISAAQFVTAVVAIAAALTGWVTLILANRRLRAERAILVIQDVRGARAGRCRIVIENVGSRPALDVAVAVADHALEVTGGLRGGESIEVVVPGPGEVALTFRDATGTERRVVRSLAEGEGGPFVMPPRRLALPVRLLVRMGFVAAP